MSLQNPYAAPNSNCTDVSPAPLSGTHELLVSKLGVLMNGELTIDELVELCDSAAESDDELVTLAGLILEDVAFESFDREKFILTPERWATFQRLRILLTTSGRVSISREVRYGPHQIIALSGVVLFLASLLWLGVSVQLVGVTVLLGLVSIVLAHLRGWTANGFSSESDVLPFHSRDDLRRAADASAHSIEPCPEQIKSVRRISHSKSGTLSAIVGVVQLLLGGLLWIVASPVILFVQIWPVSRRTVKVNDR